MKKTSNLLLLGTCVAVFLINSWMYLHNAAGNSPEDSINLKNVETKLLYCIASASADRVDVVETLLDNSYDWCEGGYHVLVIIDTYDSRYEQIFAEYSRTCITSSLRIEVHLHNHTLNLVTAHRGHFRLLIHSFDTFIYSEDDMSIPLSTLVRWQHENSLLKNPDTQMIGLLRYENAFAELRRNWKKIRQLRPDLTPYYLSKSNEQTDVQQLTKRSRISWESNPLNFTIVYRGRERRAYLTPRPAIPGIYPYAAATIFTSKQLLSLEHRCQYLSNQSADRLLPSDTTRLRAFYSGLQPIHCEHMKWPANTSSPNPPEIYSPEFFCCLEWLLPVSKGMEVLFIHHIGTPGAFADNKWSNRHRIQNAYFLSLWRELTGGKVESIDNL